MKYRTQVVTSLFLAVLVSSCTSTQWKREREPDRSVAAARQRDKTDGAAKAASRAIQDFAYAQRVELVDQLKEELSTAQEELDRLRAKVDRSSGAAKADATIKLEGVRETWSRARKQLDRTENATEATWEDVKAGCKKSYGELKDSVEKTRKWFGDTIES